MTTTHAKKTVSHATHAKHSVQQVEAAASTAPDAAAPATPTLPVIFLTAPPPSVTIPSPPKGFVPPVGGIYRGVLPQKTELAALPAAVTELAEFTDYAEILGASAPPATQVAQALDIGGQWTLMRNEVDSWDGFCRAQEGIAWTTIRAMVERLRPAFELAVASDPTIAARFPNLAALLGAKKAVAKQGAQTKLLNKQAVAEGKPPTHGAVGKRRQRAAEKQAAATLAAQGTAAPVAQSAQPAPLVPAAATSGAVNGAGR